MKLSELLSLCVTLVFVKRLKKAQRRLSKKFCQGNKQSNNYHKQRIKVARLHLKVSRQRKDKAIKDALALFQSNDLVVYAALKVGNLVKNRKLAKSISDESSKNIKH